MAAEVQRMRDYAVRHAMLVRRRAGAVSLLRDRSELKRAQREKAKRAAAEAQAKPMLRAVLQKGAGEGNEIEGKDLEVCVEWLVGEFEHFQPQASAMHPQEVPSNFPHYRIVELSRKCIPKKYP